MQSPRANSHEAAALAASVGDIARRAAREILEVYALGRIEVVTKPDDSPLTHADLRSQRVIVEGLRQITPHLPILAEESADISFAERSAWRRYWLVDPLDGTREFVSRNGEFTVNIALVEDHVPVLGVVHVPVSGVTYWGLPGQGAWRRAAGGAEERIRAAPHAASPVRVVGSRSHRGDSLDAFLARLGAHALVAVGSSLKFCLLAEGRADVYPRLGPTSEWDTAAGHAVAAAAGAVVATLDGGPLEYNRKAALLNPHFVVYADSSRDWFSLLRG